MGVAGRMQDSFVGLRVEPHVPGVGVAQQGAAEQFQEFVGPRFRFTALRKIEHVVRLGFRGTVEPEVRREAPFSQARRQQRDGRVVGGDQVRTQHLESHVVRQGLEHFGRRRHDLAQRRAARHPTALAVDVLLAIQRKVDRVLVEQHVRHETEAETSSFH